MLKYFIICRQVSKAFANGFVSMALIPFSICICSSAQYSFTGSTNSLFLEAGYLFDRPMADRNVFWKPV